MMKRCNKMGLMSSCKQELYGSEDENEDKCYYHRKVRDGVITKDDTEEPIV